MRRDKWITQEFYLNTDDPYEEDIHLLERVGRHNIIYVMTWKDNECTEKTRKRVFKSHAEAMQGIVDRIADDDADKASDAYDHWRQGR